MCVLFLEGVVCVSVLFLGGAWCVCVFLGERENEKKNRFEIFSKNEKICKILKKVDQNPRTLIGKKNTEKSKTSFFSKKKNQKNEEKTKMSKIRKNEKMQKIKK